MIELVIRRQPLPSRLEDEALGEQYRHRVFDVPEHALTPLPSEPPVAYTVQGVLGLRILHEVPQDLLRRSPFFGGSRCLLHDAP